MKRRRILLISFGLIIAVILAFFLQDIFRQIVITPLAYLFWVLKLLISSVPQLFLWIFLLLSLILIIIATLVSWIPIGRRHEKPSLQASGPVENLAGWLSNSEAGNYYKWRIANRLGKLAREMSTQMGDRGLPAHPEEMLAPGRSPSESVQRYLNAGLEESFVNYPLPRLPFKRKNATPFDLEVNEVVDYLESEMEALSGQKHP